MYDHINKYTNKKWINSIYNFIITIILLYLHSQQTNYIFCISFALTFVRLFILFHDMAHNNYFPNSKLNNFIGLLTGIIVFTPLSFWKKGHNNHHKHSNNIDEKQFSQTCALDINKYEALSYYKKLQYKLSYGKYNLFTTTPILYFIIIHKIYANFYENILQFLWIIFLYFYINTRQLYIICISYILAGMFGFLLFHMQHTFDNVYRADNKLWSFDNNGLYGSSFLQIPWYLTFFTCNIEYHHIHHLNTQVPCYNLRKCHEESGDIFSKVKRLYLSDILNSYKYSLYDNNKKIFLDVYNYKKKL
jgi:omega-6 fatty acid desaturase (delta-12 desaturase)